MGRQDTQRRFEAVRRRTAIRLLALAGIALLVAGTAGLGWTLRPVWRALGRAAGPTTVHFEPITVRTADQPDEKPAGPIRVWLAAVSNGGGDVTDGDEVLAGEETSVPDGVPAGEEMSAPDEMQPRDEWDEFFSSGERVVLHLTPPEEMNGGKVIKIVFIPGVDCEYGSGQACVSRHRGGQITLLTVHSGLGGEGEAFRSAVEGTGLDLAFYSFARIRRNMQALAGSPVRMQSGSQGRQDLSLAAVVRIPPHELEGYFASPFDEALSAAAEKSPELQAALDTIEPLLIIEICGWQIPGEALAPEVSPTTASIYLGVIKIQ